MPVIAAIHTSILIRNDVVQSSPDLRLQMQDEILETMVAELRAGPSAAGTGKPTSPRVRDSAVGDCHEALPRAGFCLPSELIKPIPVYSCHATPTSTAQFMSSIHSSSFPEAQIGVSRRHNCPPLGIG